MTQGRLGPRPGKPQQHRRVSFDPASGKPWRTGLIVQNEDAEKAIVAAEKAGLSFAGLVAQLIKRMEVDAEGRPVWADELKQQEELPKVS
jgi:hypothetical protein